jgi:hypothetical protein
MLACLSLLVQGGTTVDQPADPVQAYVNAVRVELSAGKVNLINDVMKMSAKEAAAFWPLYHQYEVELFEIGDRRLELIERLVSAHRAESLDDSEAKAMASDYFKLSTARMELFRKYHDLIATDLSPIRAIQFVQVEHRVNTVIDIMIASELPLFKYDGVPSAAQSGIPSPSTNRAKARTGKTGTKGEEEGV